MNDMDWPEDEPVKRAEPDAGPLARERAKGVGEVGCYWFFEGRLLGSWVPYTLGEEYGDFVNGHYGHVDYWPLLQKRYRNELPGLDNYEYEQVQRGRVTYRRPDETFIVLGSERFARNEGQQREVLEAFSLLDKRVVIKADEHYGDVPGMLLD